MFLCIVYITLQKLKQVWVFFYSFFTQMEEKSKFFLSVQYLLKKSVILT